MEPLKPLQKCCNNPHFVLAYTPCWPFRAKLCLNCGELFDNAHPTAEWLFANVFWRFWNGAVNVDTTKLTEAEIKKLKKLR